MSAHMSVEMSFELLKNFSNQQFLLSAPFAHNICTNSRAAQVHNTDKMYDHVLKGYGQEHARCALHAGEEIRLLLIKILIGAITKYVLPLYVQSHKEAFGNYEKHF